MTQPARNLRTIIEYLIVKEQTYIKIEDVRHSVTYKIITFSALKYIFQYNNQKISIISINAEDQTQDVIEKKYNLDSIQYESNKYVNQTRLVNYLQTTDGQSLKDRVQKQLLTNLFD